METCEVGIFSISYFHWTVYISSQLWQYMLMLLFNIHVRILWGHAAILKNVAVHLVLSLFQKKKHQFLKEVEHPVFKNRWIYTSLEISPTGLFRRITYTGDQFWQYMPVLLFDIFLWVSYYHPTTLKKPTSHVFFSFFKKWNAQSRWSTERSFYWKKVAP